MQGGFTVSDVDRMTYAECERYYRFYFEQEKEKYEGIIKRIAFDGFKGVLIAVRGTESGVTEYQNSFLPKEIDDDPEYIDSQFEEEDFEQ